MKRVNIIATFAVFILIVAAAITLFFVFNNNNGDYDLLECKNISDVKEYIEDAKVESYNFEKDSAYLSNVDVLEYNADVEFHFYNEATAQIVSYFTLFQCVDENASEEELQNFDVMSYEFTDKDKEQINSNFNKIKGKFQEKIGCTFEHYDLIPTQEVLEIEDDESKFYKGLYVREYSVRDSYGVLWLLRLEASYGMSRATLYKVVDDSGYEGFISAIDMTKE